MKLKDMVIVFDDGDWIESKDQSSEGVRLLQTGNIGEGYFVNKAERKKFISEETFEKLKCKEVYSGDILISRLPEPVGRACIVPELDSRLITAVDCTICRINEDIVNKEYLCYFFQSQSYYNQVKQKVAGTTRKRISRKNLEQIKVYLPLLDIQGKIVQKLNTVSELISYRKKQLEDFDLLVKSQFVEMFGDPVSNSMEWRMSTLSELGEFGRGVSKHRPRNAPELLGGKYPLIQTGDIASSQLYIKEHTSTYSELGFQQSKMWKNGTLCITIAANIAKTAILEFDACFPDSVVGFNANSETNNIFMHYWFTFFQKILEKQAPESAQKNINLKILSELKIITPPIELQNQLATFVQQVDKSKFSCIMK